VPGRHILLARSVRLRLGVRLLVAASLVGAGSMVGATSASATRVDYIAGPTGQPTILQIQGEPNEINDLVVSFDAATKKYTIDERHPGDLVNLLPYYNFAPSCEPSMPPAARVVCDGDQITYMDVVLGDGDDAFSLDQTVTIDSLITGGPGNDTVQGGSGTDDIEGYSGADTLRGGGGRDGLFSDGETASPAQQFADRLFGEDGNDALIGTNGTETFDGGPGNDEVRASGGNDTLEGGDGSDLLNGGDGADALAGGADNDELGTVITGAPGNVSLERGNDVMDGGPGDDLLRPGAGPEQPCPPETQPPDCSDDDLLGGGDGYDTVRFERRVVPIRASIDGIANDGQLGEADNIMPGVEKLVGGESDDTLVGGAGDDTIDGAGGDDVIDGVGGNDSLEGGTQDGGSDRIVGGDGDDNLSGSAGDDFFVAGNGNDAASGGDGADDIGGGPGDDRLSGGHGTDTIRGEAGNDELSGGEENDTLEGGDGNDALRGENGDDLLRGERGGDDLSGGDGEGDAADYESTATAIRVTLDDRANDGSGGGREHDNVHRDVEDVRGGGDEDTFFGSAKFNQLDGAAGEDYLDGGGGVDQLRAGRARDVVRARDDSRDVLDCGRSVDFAIIDPGDQVRGCEQVSIRGREKPRQGKEIVVARVRGDTEFGPPRMSRTVPLQDRIEVPVRTKIDSSGSGRIALTAEARGGTRQAADFYGGVFRIDQQDDESITQIRLGGGEGCTGTGSGPVRPSYKTQKDGVWGDTRRPRKHGRSSARASARVRASRSGGDLFRTVGAYSSATVAEGDAGTVWFTQDRCDGTLTRVTMGSVVVRDFRRDKTVKLTAGESYLARASR
jgi:Ca2+-binding RTX toxin-like protein